MSLRERLQPWAPWLLLGAMLAHHGVTWGLYARSHDVPFGVVLGHWDSNWFSGLVLNGRTGVGVDAEMRWAFLPLYLWLVGAAHEALAGAVSVYWVGTFICLLGTCLFVWVSTRDEATGQKHALAPQSAWGWFLLWFSPSSYVLHSFHTEGLFLFLTASAFWLAARGRGAGSGVTSGLAVLTRNQGPLVALASALWLWRAEPQSGRVRRVAVLAALVAVAFAGLFFYAYRGAGTPWAFFNAQGYWDHASHPLDVVRTLWFGNSSQTAEMAWLLRHAYGLSWLGFGLWMLRQPSYRPAAVFVLISFVPMLFQGSFYNAFRFSLGVFPLFFFLGDRLASRSWWVKVPVAAVWLGLNHWVLLSFARDKWAY